MKPRWIRRLKFLLCLGILPLLHLSCGGATPLPTATGLLYVLDRVNKAVYVYDNINTLNGAQDPVRTITGDNTLIQSPTAIAIDTRHDILYIADTSTTQILAFPSISQKNGNVAPLRTYPGLGKGSAMFYDLDNDRLYVGDIVNRSVQAWDGISGLASGTISTRQINLGFDPSGVFVDTKRNLLYVGNPTTASVDVFVDASTSASTSTPRTPSATIQDSTAAFVNINSLVLNTDNDILFVAESFNPSVEVFDHASTLTGSVPDTRQLEGGTTTLTTDMTQVVFVQNVLYAATDRTHVGIWDNANSVTGDTAPTRNLTVNPAALINGIAVDLAH